MMARAATAEAAAEERVAEVTARATAAEAEAEVEAAAVEAAGGRQREAALARVSRLTVQADARNTRAGRADVPVPVQYNYTRYIL